MDDLRFLFDEAAFPSRYEPTAQDWAEYQEYLDSVGYDHGDDDWDEDPDADRGFQPFEDSPF